MASVSLKHIYKTFDDGVTRVADFSLDVKDKEFVVVVGPAGCGKSTVLRMIAGLEGITGGELYINDCLMNQVAPKDRDIAMLFSNFALYPYMTVYENMAFGLKMSKLPEKEIERRIQETSQILEIERLLDRKPKALSAGQSQRVALGRAIVRKPKVYLFDDPFSNLEPKLRSQMQSELKKLHEVTGATFIYSTDDQDEAVLMGDRVVVMNDGQIQQVDTPKELYENPANLLVAGFIGTPQMNFIESVIAGKDGSLFAQVVSQSNTESMNAIKFPDKATVKIKPFLGKEVILGIRPEHIHTDTKFLSGARNIYEAEIDENEPVPAGQYVAVLLEGQRMVAAVQKQPAVEPGGMLQLAFDENKIHLFDKESEKIIL